MIQVGNDASGKLTIIRARPEDAALVRGITLRAYAKWIPVIGREPLPMTVDDDKAVLSHDIYLLLSADVPVGIVVLVRKVDEIHIDNLAVEPFAQGKGFGRHLLAHVEQVARHEKISTLTLLTNAAFASNVSFYQAYGFDVDRTELFMGGIMVYMSKRVTQS